MHILLIHQAFASLDEPGGTRHYELARHLIARGHKVTVIASRVSYLTGASSPLPVSTSSARRRGEEPKAEGPALAGFARTRASGVRENLEILRASVYTAHHKSFLHRLLAFFSFMFSSFLLGLRVPNVDVVWGTSPPIFQGATAWLLARLKGARFLLEVRDLWPQFAIAVGVLKNPVLVWLSESLERFLYRRADRLIVNSPGFVQHVEDVVLSAGRSPQSKGRSGKRVVIVPNSADASMFDPSEDGADFRRAHGLQDEFVVMYAGAHGISNDLGVVLDAAHMLIDEKSIQIVFLGDGKEKPALQTRAATLGLSNVTFLSPVPKSGMPAALAGADACLAILKPLDEYKTTYPNKVFDYMAAGRPVILAIDGVIRQVVETSGCGLFAQPGKPAELAGVIRKLAEDRKRAREMGLKGRKYLEENFSREKMAEKLVKLLEEMVVQR